MGRGIGSGTKSTWKTALIDTPTTDVEGVGTIREEHGPQGYRRFVWARCAQSGGFAAGDPAMYGLTWGGVTVSVVDGVNSQLTVIASGGNVSFIQSTVTTDALIDVFVDDWVVVVSTVTAGGAPEAEVRKIRKNTSNKFWVATDFSVAPSVEDTFNIIRPYNVVDAATTQSGSRVAGIAMAACDLDDYLWLQTKGLNFAVTVETAEHSRNGPAIIGPGGAEIASNIAIDAMSNQTIPGAVLGFFVASIQIGLTALKAPIMLDI